jgi:cysteinyl-tRNA synthetase
MIMKKPRQCRRLKNILMAAFLLIGLLVSACQPQDAVEEARPYVPETTAAVTQPVSEPDWLGVKDFLYQLQHADRERIGKTAFDLAVVSIATAGNSPAAIPALKDSPGGPKLILCYMSIGQAEDYRWYWQADWPKNPPEWLDKADTEWAGDYWVKYWDPDWQRIIYGTPESYLDQIIALGFDGVYLDRVDAYEYYQEQGRESAARDMVGFILAFTDYARKIKPGFGVFPQNAEELGIQFPDYLQAMTGIGVEDLYYGYPREHEPSPPDWTAAREAILDQWVAAGKLVLSIDYSGRSEQIADAYSRSLSHGYVEYVTDRALGRLRINPGFEPDKDPSQWALP